MDRNIRINNPKNFNEDSTVKRGIKLIWKTSKKYLKAKNKLKDIQRKQADIRKLEHNILANKIISKCSIIKTEKISYKGLQRKSKETTANEKTKCSQYNHLTNEYIKKELKERSNIFNYKNKEIHIQAF